MIFDFENLETTGRDNADLVVYRILTVWDRAVNELHRLQIKKNKGRSLGLAEFHGVLTTLFYIIEPSLKDFQKKDIEGQLATITYESLLNTFKSLGAILYDKKLLRYDTKYKIPKGSAVQSNYIKGKI